MSWYARPVFFVTSCADSLPFYESLGFTDAWRHEEAGRVVAVQVGRNGAELILNENADRAGGGRLFLSLERGEATRLADEWRAAGIEVSDARWGMPVKVTVDPDGNDVLMVDDDVVETDGGNEQ